MRRPNFGAAGRQNEGVPFAAAVEYGILATMRERQQILRSIEGGDRDDHSVGAELNVAVWRGVVEGFLRQKLQEIRSNPRYRDRGYYDAQLGKYVARGGVWNDRSGRCVDGVTRADVEDICKILGKVGLRITFDEADALLTRYARTGELSNIVVRAHTASGLQPIIDLRWPQREERPRFTEGGFDFMRAASGVFLARKATSSRLEDVHAIIVAEAPMCICGRQCGALRAFVSRRNRKPRRAAVLTDPRNGPPMREALELARRLGMGEPGGREAGRPTDNVANALLLIARALYGRHFKSSSDIDLMLKSGDLPKRNRNAPARFKKRPGVLRALRAIYALASNALKANGINLPEAPNDAGADLLISSCCAALHLRAKRLGSETAVMAA